MKSRKRPILVALAVLLAGGALRLPMEHAATADFRRQGLLAVPLKIDVREKIGQNSAVVALAGLRTLVANFASLRATEQFTHTLWPELEESVDTTVQLSPRTRYYWDIGAWHMAYNAASSYRDDMGLGKLRAQAESRRWVEKGRAFFERGALNNPGNADLLAALGSLYSDPYRFPDDAKAVDAFSRAIATGHADDRVRRYLIMARARTGEEPGKLLPELQKLMAEDSSNRTPTMMALQYALEAGISPPADPVAHAVEIFGSEAKALRILGSYFSDINERLPQTGVEIAVRLLERRAGISPDNVHSYIFQRDYFKARDSR